MKDCCDSSSEQAPVTTRIKEGFNNIKLSISSYDTAWVATVPSENSMDNKPRLPECLKWIMENQNKDGSWTLDHFIANSLLIKDSLSSTLACLLALHKWKVAELPVKRRISFSLACLVKREMRKQVEIHRIELLRLMLQKKGSVVPKRYYTDIYNQIYMIETYIITMNSMKYIPDTNNSSQERMSIHHFFMSNDGFTSTETMFNAVNAVSL
ncbi:hypothetical protein WN943_004588 [Citrus x changshan-huyou]